MGLQHSTERGKRMDYQEDENDSMTVRKDVENGDDMIARTLIISVKKSPTKKKMTPKKRSSPTKKKTTPSKKMKSMKSASPPTRRKKSPAKKKSPSTKKK